MVLHNDDENPMFHSDPLRTLFWILGSFSVVASLLVMLCYSRVKDMKSNNDVTNKIVFCIGLCDFFFSMSFLVAGAIDSDQFFKTDICTGLGGWTHFWGLGTVSWNMFFSLNMIIMLRDPMGQTHTYFRFYNIYVWLVCIVTTAVIGAKDQFGPSGNGTCWIPGSHNPYRLFFLFPLLASYILSVIAVIFSLSRISQLSHIDKHSQVIRRRMILYAAVFVLFWAGPLIHRCTEIAYNNKIVGFIYLDGVAIAAQAAANACVWLTHPKLLHSIRKFIDSKRKETLLPNEQAQLLDREEEIPRITEVLRKDWTWCLLCGIREAAEALEDMLRKEDNTFFNKESPSAKEQIESEWFNFRYKAYLPKRDGNAVLDDRKPYLFVEYAPRIFKQIRERFGISNEKYLSSLSPELFHKIQEKMSTQGRSGSFFFFSYDKRFLIKTLPQGELDMLISILPEYHKHLLEYQDTLIAKFYGAYAMKLSQEKIFYVVVMASAFNTTLTINSTYDIKGSWVKRYVGGRRDQGISGKDMDLKKQLFLGQDRKDRLLAQVDKDTDFLCNLGIIDYSLLLGVHLVNKRGADSFKKRRSKRGSFSEGSLSINSEEPPPVRELTPSYESKQVVPFFQEDQGGMLSSDGHEIYYFGVIDILTKYNGDKRMERFWKVYVLNNDKYGVSVLPPVQYKQRFIGFLTKAIA